MLRWGVIGVGRAGQARARALHQDPRAKPLYGFRGQPQAVGLRRVDDLGELLRRVDAVAICSPDTTHADLVRMAIAAGCHVVVEFPLAGSAEIGAVLVERAATAQLGLHVGHIELLSGAALLLRQACAGRQLSAGSVSFSGPIRRDTYGIASANIARLHRVVDAVGLPQAVCVRSRSPRHLAAALRYGDAVVELHFHHGDELPRSTRLSLQLDAAVGRPATLLEQQDRVVVQDGKLLAAPAGLPLFVQDQLLATQSFLDGTRGTLQHARILAVLRLADALVRASPGGAWMELPVGAASA